MEPEGYSAQDEVDSSYVAEGQFCQGSQHALPVYNKVLKGT